MPTPHPRHAKQSVHHLIHKLKGSERGPTLLLHQICHNEIHATLTESELARGYNSPEKLRAHLRLAAFIQWVASKPPHFYARSRKSLRQRKR